MEQTPRRTVVPPVIDWDDELWELTWERRLDQVERHDLGLTVLRGRLPDADPFVAAVGRELARRWRRTLLARAALWLTWVGFWLLMVVLGMPETWLMQASMVVLGAVVVGILLWLRRRLARPIAEADRRIALAA